MARCETETLSRKENQAQQNRRLTKLILGMDNSVSETDGHQQGSAYNGHFGCTCYHLLFLFNRFGDLERVMLWRGIRGSAKEWLRVALPVIECCGGLGIAKFFRDYAAFAGPNLLRLLKGEGFRYATREGAPLFRGNALKSLTRGGSLV